MVGKGVSEAVEAVLSLVARGNAVLAEIERLRDVIPLLYRYCWQLKKKWLKLAITILLGFN